MLPRALSRNPPLPFSPRPAARALVQRSRAQVEAEAREALARVGASREFLDLEEVVIVNHDGLEPI